MDGDPLRKMIAWMERKVKLSVDVAALKLPRPVQKRLIQLAVCLYSLYDSGLAAHVIRD